MSSSKCCFLTCIQISQETGQVVWYSHLFKNFCLLWSTQSKFGIVNKAEVDVFLELSHFFDDPMDVGNLISGSSAFSKSSLNIWKFTVHILLKVSLENFEHYFTSMWDGILILIICWRPCVESSLVVLEKGVCYDLYVLLAKLLVFDLLHFVVLGQIRLFLLLSLDLLLLHSNPLLWTGCPFSC